MTISNSFIDKYNALVGALVTILTAVFGAHWYFFAAFLALNIVDWLTGWYKARKKKTESSKAGAHGAFKKLGYWAIVLVAFVIGGCFVHIGDEFFGINLNFLNMIGWWVLAMLIINEARSILENLVELGYKVPDILIKGLAVTEKLIAAKADLPEIETGQTNTVKKE